MSDSDKIPDVDFVHKSRRSARNRRNRRRDVDKDTRQDWRDYRQELDPFTFESLEDLELLQL